MVLKDKAKPNKAIELYNLKTEIPIAPDMNKLNRPLIPMFRHDKYRYAQWPRFKAQVMNSLINK